jgi:hypothetical protein
MLERPSVWAQRYLCDLDSKFSLVLFITFLLVSFFKPCVTKNGQKDKGILFDPVHSVFTCVSFFKPCVTKNGQKDQRKSHISTILRVWLSVRPLAIWFPEHNLSSIWPTIFKLYRMIVHIGKKTPIDFGVTRSKVKVTITLKLKTVSGT